MSDYFYSLGMLLRSYEGDGWLDYMLNIILSVLIANEENQ